MLWPWAVVIAVWTAGMCALSIRFVDNAFSYWVWMFSSILLLADLIFLCILGTIWFLQMNEALWLSPR